MNGIIGIIESHLDLCNFTEDKRGLFYLGCACKSMIDHGKFPYRFGYDKGLDLNELKDLLIKAISFNLESDHEIYATEAMRIITPLLESWQLTDVETMFYLLSGFSFMTGLNYKLSGVSEAAQILGWDKRKISTYIQRGKFPEPLQRLASGPLWTRKQIEDYKLSKDSE